MASLYEHEIYRPRNSALPLGVFWVGAFAALTYLELQVSAPRWVLLLVTALAGLAALLHIGHSLIRLLWAVRTYGRHLPAFMNRMIRMFPRLARSRSETIKVLFHTSLAAFGFVLAAGLGVSSVLSLSALLLGIATTALLRVVLPPGGIYLASSDPERIKFFARLSERIIPGFAALLEVSTLVEPKREGFLRNAIGVLFDFRTSDPNHWPDVVKQLIEMAALVVVDCRDQTPGVEFEVERIMRNRLEFKTVFLSPDGTLPSVLRHLNVKPSHPSGEFLLMTPDQALQAVPEVIMGAKALWKPVLMDA